MLDTTKHTILSGAKDKVASEVRSYLSRDVALPPVPLAVNDKVANGIDGGDYTTAIRACMTSYDQVQGISVTIRGDHLIRDARDMEADEGYAHKKAQADLVAYTGQFLSSCRAFEAICKAEGKSSKAETQYVRDLAACMYKLAHSQGNEEGFQESRRALIDLMNQHDSKNALIKKMMKNPNLLPSIEQLNYELESALVKVGVKRKDVAKKMDAAKEFSSLMDPHYHITTVSREPSSRAEIIESSIKAPSLSAETIKELELIKRLAPILSSLSKRKADIPWFDELSTFNRKLVINHIDEILMAGKGEKVLPTQLRKILPGLKNAYLEVRQVKREGQVSKTVLEGLRSASPACLLKKGAEKATEENVRVIQELAGKKEVCLNGLFTPWQPGGGNRDASSLINNAVKSLNKKGNAVIDASTPVDKKGRFVFKDKQQLKSAFTPANIGRVFSKHGNTFSNMLKDAAAHLAVLIPDNAQFTIGMSDEEFRAKNKSVTQEQARYKRVVEYIRSGKGRSKEMNALIDNFSFEDDTKRALKNLVECRRMEKQWIHWPDRQNTNYNRSARLAMVAQDFSEGGILRKQINATYEREAENHKRNSEEVRLHAIPGHAPQTPYSDSDRKDLEKKHPMSAIISFCMSGKDRNGIRNNHAAVLAVSRELGDDGVNLSVANAVVGAGHQSYLAGVQGATACCFGTKKDSRGSMPQVYKDAGLQDELCRKTASANKFKVDRNKAYSYEFQTEAPDKSVVTVHKSERQATEPVVTIHTAQDSWQNRHKKSVTQDQGQKR